jgi:hypothetical protein
MRMDSVLERLSEHFRDCHRCCRHAQALRADYLDRQLSKESHDTRLRSVQAERIHFAQATFTTNRESALVAGFQATEYSGGAA